MLLLLKYYCANADEMLTVVPASLVSKMLVFEILVKLCQWPSEIPKWSWVLTKVVWFGGKGLSQGRRWN